jgi:uncharacterized linocin/CFP29 family protein
MALIKRSTSRKIVVDLAGPKGNAYVLLSSVVSLGRQLGMDAEEIEAIQEEMRSSNYKHLVETFDSHFGTLVDLILPEKGL